MEGQSDEVTQGGGATTMGQSSRAVGPAEHHLEDDNDGIGLETETNWGIDDRDDRIDDPDYVRFLASLREIDDDQWLYPDDDEEGDDPTYDPNEENLPESDDEVEIGGHKVRVEALPSAVSARACELCLRQSLNP
jgi:hypothetical protein